MTKLRLTAFCLAMLTLAGCSQAPTDPAKASVSQPASAQTQPPASYVPSDRGGDGGGGGY